MATASNLYINWSGVTVTPTAPSGSAITLDGVTEIDIDAKSALQSFYGDARKFPRLNVPTQKSRSITIKGGNIGKLLTLPEDAECTIVAILNDAKNGAGIGSITFTATKAVMDGKPFKGANNQFAMGEVTFHCSGNVDDEDPIAYAVGT